MSNGMLTQRLGYELTFGKENYFISETVKKIYKPERQTLPAMGLSQPPLTLES